MLSLNQSTENYIGLLKDQIAEMILDVDWDIAQYNAYRTTINEEYEMDEAGKVDLILLNLSHYRTNFSILGQIILDSSVSPSHSSQT